SFAVRGVTRYARRSPRANCAQTVSILANRGADRFNCSARWLTQRVLGVPAQRFTLVLLARDVVAEEHAGVTWPLMRIATDCGPPALPMFRAPDRRRSWNSLSSRPDTLQAAPHTFRQSPRGTVAVEHERRKRHFARSGAVLT